MLDSFYLDPNAVTGPDPLGILMVAVIAYFCGCFNGAVIVSKYILRDDVRNHGSGNAGLTNFYRTFGGPLTFVVILCDVLKAVVAVLLGGWLLGTVAGANGYAANERISSMWALFGEYWAALFCLLGHMFPCMFHFKGGKGIAVAVGCLFVTFGWVGACLELLIFIVLVVATKRVSIGSIAAALSCPFFSLYYFWGDWIAVALCTLAGLTVVWAHRENIKRLRAGTESRIGDKKKA